MASSPPPDFLLFDNGKTRNKADYNRGFSDHFDFSHSLSIPTTKSFCGRVPKTSKPHQVIGLVLFVLIGLVFPFLVNFPKYYVWLELCNEEYLSNTIGYIIFLSAIGTIFLILPLTVLSFWIMSYQLTLEIITLSLFLASVLVFCLIFIMYSSIGSIGFSDREFADIFKDWAETIYITEMLRGKGLISGTGELIFKDWTEPVSQYTLPKEKMNLLRENFSIGPWYPLKKNKYWTRPEEWFPIPGAKYLSIPVDWI